MLPLNSNQSLNLRPCIVSNTAVLIKPFEYGFCQNNLTHEAKTNKINQLTIPAKKLAITSILLNFIHEPDVKLAKNLDLTKGNPQGSLYLDRTNPLKDRFYQRINGKSYALQLRNNLNCSQVIQELTTAAENDGKIMWNELNKYFIGVQRSLNPVVLSSRRKILDSNTYTNLNGFNADGADGLLDILKSQGRDQILAISDEKNDEHYFYYNLCNNKLSYLQAHEKFSRNEINTKLQTESIYKLFPEILLEQIEEGLTQGNAANDKAGRALSINLPQNLVNLASSAALVNAKNLKCGLNVATEYFEAEIDPVNPDRVILQFKLEVPKSCIQHTEYLINRASGADQEFNYLMEALGESDDSYSYSMVGEYLSQDRSTTKINFSNDDVMLKLRERPVLKQEIALPLPNYGEGLALLATEVDKYQGKRIKIL